MMKFVYQNLVGCPDARMLKKKPNACYVVRLLESNSMRYRLSPQMKKFSIWPLSYKIMQSYQ